MDVSRVLIKTSDDVANLSTLGEGAFDRAVSHYERHCFGSRNRFEHAIWGEWSGNDWRYQGYGRVNGYLERADDVRGVIRNFTNTVTGGAHGRVDFANFAAAYLGGPFVSTVPVLNEIPSPMFSVVDHNSAHHVALPLVLKSMRGLGARRPLVLINFDAHTDHANVAGFDEITCQNWSTLLLRQEGRPRWLAGETIDRYVVFGLKSFGTQAVRAKSWTKGGEYAESSITEIQPGNARTPAHVLRYLLGNMDGKVAYVTIDRDFTSGSSTPYGDGSYSSDEGRVMIKDCLDYLKARQVPLIGFDLHGLPVGVQTERVMEQAYGDVRFCHELVNDY